MVALNPLALLAAAALGAQPAQLPDAARLESLARDVGRRVEEIRGLKFEREVAVKVVDDAAAREHFRTRVMALYPQERLAHDQAALTQLGLLPPGTSLLDSLLDLLEEQAGGYYDPASDTFFVLDDIPPDTAPMLMAHELTHALDDQHYDLDALLEQAGLDDDRTTALSAVVEGSGTAVMSVFTVREIQAGRMRPDVLEQIRESEAGRAERLRAAPPYIQRSLIAPYTLGLSFVLRGDPGRLLGGELHADLDRVFRDPPRSTEQILHPEKYWGDAPDEPLPLELADLSGGLGAGWSLASSGRLGELTLGVLTGARAPDLVSPDALEPGLWSDSASSGLAGDLFHHYANGERSFTLEIVVWDTPRDADEFVGRLGEIPGRRTFQAGERVLFLAGDVPGDADALARRVMSSLRTGH